MTFLVYLNVDPEIYGSYALYETFVSNVASQT